MAEYKIEDFMELAKKIKAAGKEIAYDKVSKEYFLERRYYDTIYVKSDGGFEAIVIGDATSKCKGYMYLYHKNTSKRNSYPSVRVIAHLLKLVAEEVSLEEGEGKASYKNGGEFDPLEKQRAYFAAIVKRMAGISDVECNTESVNVNSEFVKGFHIPHKAWYADFNMLIGDTDLMIGIYDVENGGCRGEFKVCWDKHGIYLRAYDDSWAALAELPELTELLKNISLEKKIPDWEMFVEMLKGIGLKDLTEYERNDSLPVLWKEDDELGIAYFCPHCKTFQCSGDGYCSECKRGINWKERVEYTGPVKW